MKFELNAAADVERWISDSPSWQGLNDEQFGELVSAGLILYGSTMDGALVPQLFPLYMQAVKRLTRDQRLRVHEAVTSLLDQDQISPVGLLPIVICDPDLGLASTATINLLAYSRLTETGLPYGLMELIPLLSKRVPENMGAVFGGLVSFGDSQIRISMDTAKGYLTNEEVRLAARCTTGFPTHAAIDFWLEWAKELTLDGSDDALGKLGSAASAIVLQKRNARVEVVRDIKRNYPAQSSKQPLECIREWTFAEYAAFIAPRLYALEAAETPPKIFSAVLETWGLEPRALEMDRVNL
jgi:hypothetical protein